MRRWAAGLLLMVCILVGCDQRALIEKATPKEDADFAKQYIGLFQKSDFAAIEARMSPSIKNAQLRPTLMLMATMLPPEAPVSIEVVGVEATQSADGSSTTSLSLQYEFPKAWILVNIDMSRAGGAIVVDGIYFTPLQGSLKEINAFAIAGKPVSSYLILAMSVLVPVFIIASLICCIVTPIPKRKWLWCILVFVSVGSIGVNWTTGETSVSLLWAGLLNMGFGRLGLDGPYYFQTCIPVGATVFWIRRRSWMRIQRADNSGQARNQVER